MKPKKIADLEKKIKRRVSRAESTVMQIEGGVAMGTSALVGGAMGLPFGTAGVVAGMTLATGLTSGLVLGNLPKVNQRRKK